MSRSAQFADCLRMLHEFVREDAAGCRRPLRPFAWIMGYFYLGIMLLVVIIAFPLMFIFFKGRRLLGIKRAPDAYDRLRDHVYSIPSGLEGLALLRKVWEEVRAAEGGCSVRAPSVAPYGKFRCRQYTALGHLLCHWELHYGNFAELGAIADPFLRGFYEYPRPAFRDDEMLIYKAKAIQHLDGDGAAAAFLIKYGCATDVPPDSPAAEFLRELRESQSRDGRACGATDE